jgi:preprotein translocase subunit SecA
VKTPAATYRQTSFHPPSPLLKGLDARMNSLIGIYRRRAQVVADLRRDAEQVDAMAREWTDLTDHDLHQRLIELRASFRRGGKEADQFVLPALAGIREASVRKLGLRPFIVQIMGALALHRGYLAEMATGEGKTLTAGLAAIVAGWTKRPCHIVTVNDYLVGRDSEWIEPLYHFCGVRVGRVTGELDPVARAKGYDADVTYVTSKELLADFLRDRLRLSNLTNPSRRLIRELLKPPGLTRSVEGLVMRGLDTCIVDEADSVLIDEAVTPLIISAPQKNPLLERAVVTASRIVSALEPDSDYERNIRYGEIELSAGGRKKLIEACNELDGIWRGIERRDELIVQALIAREFFRRDKQYIIHDGKIIIVDEFTGRQMPQRTWRQGLHQAIEAKEGLPISDPSETIARLSFQRFFRCFRKLSGMTGTAHEAAPEFWHNYKLPVVTIPTNRPCIRERWKDKIFSDETSKWNAVADEIQRLHSTGRPILVGTRSIAASERLAALLRDRHLDFNLLNAVRHSEEAAIVSMAGERGRITVATNMAGRGTDIKLGTGVADLGGLHVVATERHESGRVDRQLFGRAARQGDAGSAQAFVSVEDELIRRFLPKPARTALNAAVQNRFSGWQTIARSAFSLAQKRAQAQAAKQRVEVLRADTWLEESLSFVPNAGI